MLGCEIQERHGEVREHDLTDRTLTKGKKSVVSLLDELAGDRGMGWADIAEVLDVSVSAIRKWRKDGDASPASRSKLPGSRPFLTYSKRRDSFKTQLAG